MLDKGTIVAAYRVDGVLGEGGMGTVYRATQLSLNRTIALKILSAALSEDAAFRERFRREGLLQAAIDHEHIVTVYEAGETEHGLFLAMRLIRGPTLKNMILARELDAERSLRILRQVADALDAAHEVGLTHRDIKPQNILVGARDHAYLADFGLTKSADEVRLTGTGQFIGTIDYVAPEQIQGEPAGVQSDVYALTGVLYECLTGGLAFARPTEAAVVFAHVTEPPPRASERAAGLPEAIDEVVARGMAKAPEDRYATAGELVRSAARALGIETAEATALRPPAPAAAPAGAATVPSPVVGSPGGATVTRGTAGAAAATVPAQVAGGPAVAAPGAPTVPARAPARPRRRLPLAVTAGVAALAAVAGFLLAGSGSDGDGPALTSSASAGSLSFSYPGGWGRAPEQPRIPGLRFSDAIVLAPAGGSTSRLVAGGVEGSGPTLLPPSFVAGLTDPPERGEPVKLGELEAYRYSGLRPEGSRLDLTVYAIPTGEGVAALACAAERGASRTFREHCDRVATTVTLSGARALPLGPSEDYSRLVSGAVARLETARARGQRRLRAASSQAAQAEAAAGLAQAYRRASRALSGASVGPAEAGANAALAAALRDAGRAYDRLVAAARGGDEDGYAAARRAVRRAEGQARRRLQGLEALGYSIAG
jgi:hypothetical protein